MDMNTLIVSITENMANDVYIEAFCQQNYGRPARFFCNFDARNLPGEDDCPAVFVLPAAKEYLRTNPRGTAENIDALDVICMVHDADMRAHPTISTITEYSGVRNAETLRKLVLSSAAATIDDTAGQISGANVEYDPITEFPFVMVSMLLHVATPWTIGAGNPFTAE